MRHRFLVIFGAMLVLMFAGIAQAQDDALYTLTPLDNESVDDTFDGQLTAQLYGFYASEGDSVTINMQQVTNSLDPFLILLDATGAIIAVDDDSDPDVDFAALIEDVDIPQDGAYFIIATSIFYINGDEPETPGEEDYTLTVTGNTVPDDVDDPDEISLEAEIIEIGSDIEAEISEDNPFAIFVLSVEDEADVFILLDTLDFLSTVHLFDADGARLAVDPSIIEGTATPDEAPYLILVTDAFSYEIDFEDGFFEFGVFTLFVDGG